MVWGAFANSKVGDLHLVKGKLNQSGYHSILHYHVEWGLWVKDLYSWKMMSKSILVSSARGTLKAKRNSISFNMFRPVQSANLNPIELVWDELDRKVRVKQATSETHLWQLFQESWAELSSVYLQSSFERMLRICKVIAAKGGTFWWIKSLRILCFFLFDLFLMWLR